MDHNGHIESTAKRRKFTNETKTGRRVAACQQCRLRKSKCDGRRPTCALCATTEKECTYLNEPDESLTLNGLADIISKQLEGIADRLDRIEASTAARQSVVYEGVPALPATHITDAALLHLPQDHSTHLEHEQVESARDYSHLPPHSTTADTVLRWPIFENEFADNYLIQPLLNRQLKANGDEPHRNDDEFSFTPFSQHAPLDEHQIPYLVDCFLENVHTKNPVLDVVALVKSSREAASRGISWNAVSCLLLLACALGLVAKPFGSEGRAMDDDISLEAARHIAGPTKEREQAENCFVQATRRLGMLKPTIIGSQCYFFAGVFLMYTLRPMLAWQYFHQASILYQLYLKINGRVSADNIIMVNRPLLPGSVAEQQHRLEQRLYWSCFKSEAEFRVELPLPQSELASYIYPDLFPSPPSPVAAEAESTHETHQPIQLLSRVLSNEQNEDIRLHAKKLCSEEESWYYYLTEVALRRIGNRIINTFFRCDKHEWLRIDALLEVATEFEAQVATWQTNLPSAMQKYETNSTIRAPRLTSPGGAEASFVSRELSWATENRLLEMRSWLYQPFLYYLVHVRPPIPAYVIGGAHALTQEVGTASSHELLNGHDELFWSFITKAIDCSLTILETRSIPHRHHGLWFDLRAIICSTLLLIAVVRSGYEALIPGGRDKLVGPQAILKISSSIPTDVDEPTIRSSHIGGQFGKVLKQLDIWSYESPDMVRSRLTLQMLIRQTFLTD